jgi:DNA-binding transcriptional MerR regulator
MIKIGDFSKLSQVSIKALRLYDQIGLLKPIEVDSSSGYRFYSASQLPRLNRILAFKGLGFSLEQISQLLDQQIPSAQIRGMLILKHAELTKSIDEERIKLARVEAKIKQIEHEHIMSNQEVVIKKITPIRVASIRETLSNYAAIGALFQELYQHVARQGMSKFEYDARSGMILVIGKVMLMAKRFWLLAQTFLAVIGLRYTNSLAMRRSLALCIKEAIGI